MYAMIKDSTKILINRLDSNEKVLLQQIAENSKNAEIAFSELDGETGDFDGVIINVNPIVPKTVEPTEAIETILKPYKNELLTYKFPVPEDVNILIKYEHYDKLDITSIGNTITIKSPDIVEDTLKYEIREEGFEPLYGEIKIEVVERTEAIVTLSVTPEPDRLVVLDNNDTMIKVEEDGTYLLPLGVYRYKASKLDYKQKEEEFEITQEDIDQINITIDIELEPKD
ncbi:MAG: hypothetical protein IJF92_00080 [Bacilli bacterium]|nr:hypothetical protein [Bacilli bacterium]MBQ3307613.1 hypothetical protein [Bacilli bacterium]MBQ3422180.1 hypothetical protein [Romboutsia sp.]